MMVFLGQRPPHAHGTTTVLALFGNVPALSARNQVGLKKRKKTKTPSFKRHRVLGPNGLALLWIRPLNTSDKLVSAMSHPHGSGPGVLSCIPFFYLQFIASESSWSVPEISRFLHLLVLTEVGFGQYFPCKQNVDPYYQSSFLYGLSCRSTR